MSTKLTDIAKDNPLAAIAIAFAIGSGSGHGLGELLGIAPGSEPGATEAPECPECPEIDEHCPDELEACNEHILDLVEDIEAERTASQAKQDACMELLARCIPG